MENFVKVTFIAETVGSTLSEYPDNKITIEFDASDAHITVMHNKYRDLLRAMGYQMNNKIIIDEIGE